MNFGVGVLGCCQSYDLISFASLLCLAVKGVVFLFSAVQRVGYFFVCGGDLKSVSVMTYRMRQSVGNGAF
ncbi:hypothetical protein MIDIC_560008 [Alphaproteobacteria bacterium]